jgi:hypothetical protein
LWIGPECSNGIRSQSVDEQVHLRKGRKIAKSIGGLRRRQQQRLETIGNGDKVFRKNIGLEFGNRAFGISSRI